MRLSSVHVTNFRPVVDSGAVEIGDVTVLVGKNESGKTSFLTAIEQLNPAGRVRDLDVVRDYPRWVLGEGEAAVAAGRPPVVLDATYELSDQEQTEFESVFGSGTLTTSIRAQVTYDNERLWWFNDDEAKAVAHLIAGLGSPPTLSAVTTLAGLHAAVAADELAERLAVLQADWGDVASLRGSMLQGSIGLRGRRAPVSSRALRWGGRWSVSVIRSRDGAAVRRPAVVPEAYDGTRTWSGVLRWRSGWRTRGIPNREWSGAP